MVEMLGEGVVDDADEGLELVGECERYINIWMSVHEVGGSVDWVDYEGGGWGEAAGSGGLFA